MNGVIPGNDLAASLRDVNHHWVSSAVSACRDVSLDLHTGSLHALVGENGAGKTTLGLILAGVLRPDSGLLRLGSRKVILNEKPKGTIQDIALIRQRNIWPPVLTVREAAILGQRESPRKIREQFDSFNRTAEDWELTGINPRDRISGMDAASLQRAEMIAALMFNPKILILDEPSSAWEEGRADEFFHLMSRLKDAGKAVLLITHRLEDVFSIADRVTVMRHGLVTGSWKTEDTDYSMITREMFGDQPEFRASSRKKTVFPGKYSGEPGIRAVDIGVIDAGKKVLEGINFQLQPGEILGITGLREEGLSTLEDVMTGNRRVDTGKLFLDSEPWPPSASGLRKAGLHYVPSDKTGRGSSLSSTLTENMIILETQNLSRSGWFLRGRIREWIDESRIEGGISGKPDQKLGELSGGNIQKVILQRELNDNTRLLIIADPAWGLDERSRHLVYERIRDIRNRGAAILLLASDLDEALELSDRMGVLSAGRLSDMKQPDSWNRTDAARMIAGMRKTENSRNDTSET